MLNIPTEISTLIEQREKFLGELDRCETETAKVDFCHTQMVLIAHKPARRLAELLVAVIKETQGQDWETVAAFLRLLPTLIAESLGDDMPERDFQLIVGPLRNVITALMVAEVQSLSDLKQFVAINESGRHHAV